MLIEGKDYELVMADECFDDNNDSLIYGIHWLEYNEGTEEFDVIECSWFKTEEERQGKLNETY